MLDCQIGVSCSWPRPFAADQATTLPPFSCPVMIPYCASPRLHRYTFDPFRENLMTPPIDQSPRGTHLRLPHSLVFSCCSRSILSHLASPRQDSCSRVAFDPLGPSLSSQPHAEPLPMVIDGQSTKGPCAASSQPQNHPPEAVSSCLLLATDIRSSLRITWLCRLLSNASCSSPPLRSRQSPMSRRRRLCAARLRTRMRPTTRPSPSTPAPRRARSTLPTSPTGTAYPSPGSPCPSYADAFFNCRGIYSGYNFRECHDAAGLWRWNGTDLGFSSVEPTDIVPAPLTHILYAFADVSADTGGVALTDSWADEQVCSLRYTEGCRRVS